MCGILGIISERAIAPGLADRAKRFLRHRGPDGDGEFRTRLQGKRELLFVHTRLSIIDLKEGAQPMWDAERRWLTVFNGEIYNYIELREELRTEGCRFKTGSDTEVLVTAIARWGAERALPRFNGMFAFAAYSPENDELILGRDRFGIKPLYLIDEEKNFCFCSELGTLIRLGLTSERISNTALELYLAQYSLPAPWSMIEGVEKLRPGYFIRIKEGQRKDIRYWSPQWKPDIKDPVEAVELFDMHMIQALQRQFRSDVPVGISLSGGLDSCALLAYAVQELGIKPVCFSLAFEDTSFDESLLSREMASYAGVDIKVKTMEPTELLNQMRYVLSHYGEPMGDWSVGLVAIVSQYACSDHKVLLVGSGGDELFAGYPTLNAYHYAKQYRRLPMFFRNSLKKVVGKIPSSDKNMGLDFKVRRFLHGADFEPDVGHLKYKEIFSEEEREELLGHQPHHGLKDLLANIDCLQEPQEEERLLWLDFNTFMQSNVLAGFDAASMAYGVEMRVPFLDNDFYEFSLRLDPAIKFSRRTTKPLVRRALAQRVPVNIQSAPKRGFVYPIDKWFRNELKEQVNSLLERDTLYDMGLNGDKFLDYWRDHCEGRVNRGRQISAMLSLLLWCEEVFAIDGNHMVARSDV